jgi:2-keto-4-pentenoate hydratase
VNLDEIARAAERLRTAEADHEPTGQLTDDWPDMTVEDAYAVQLANVARRLDAGDTIGGHKVGLSSRAMQQMMGVDEPDFGHLLGSMFIANGATVETSRFCWPRVEIETAFRLGDRLEGPECTIDDVLAATEAVFASIELIDSRIKNWEIKLPDTIADNASSGALVLGDTPTTATDVDLRLVGAVLYRNGEVVESGAGAAVLGHPAASVAWLVNKLHGFGTALEPGHVILPGSCTRAVDVHPGDEIVAEFATLGTVTARFS